MTVLILTDPLDVSTDDVVKELQRRAVPVHRMDTADFPSGISLSATIGDGDQRWAGQIRDAHRAVELGDITAVYYRCPQPYRMPEGMSDYERHWATMEARLGVGGILASLDCRWLSHPHRIAAANYKPRQLRVAVEVGLTIPRTLITNDPHEAMAFASTASCGLIYKPLHSTIYVDDGHVMALPTTQVTADDLDESIAGTATLLQHWIPKSHEVRVTVVDGRVFAARIDAGSVGSRIDWRTDYASLTYSVTDVPEQVTAGLLALMDRLGLHYGAIDMIVDSDDRWTFLEINPNGQWAWIEHETGLSIAAAIADYLEDK